MRIDVDLSSKIAETYAALQTKVGTPPALARAKAIEGSVKRYGMDSVKVTFDTEQENILDQLDALYEVAKNENDNSTKLLVSGIRNALAEPDKGKVHRLQAFMAAFSTWIMKDRIDGWLYAKEGNEMLAYLVTGIEFHPARSKDDEPYIDINLSANTAQTSGERGRTGASRSTIKIRQGDLGDTIPAIMAKEGYYHETPEFKKDYDDEIALFVKYRPMKFEQFRFSGWFSTGDRWDRKRVKHTNKKVLNDEPAINRTMTPEMEVQAKFMPEEATICEVPLHPLLYVYHLEFHHHFWCRAKYLTPYVYDTTVTDKIVLDANHRDLLDILTTDVDVLMEDIVDGKSGGTTILCVGKPGLGKTLTAEVYAEIIKRPLLRVAAGQLGTRPEDVEKNLKMFLERAAAWGVVLLLDEADVYIRRRGDDLHHNAVVAAFLQTLEYFSGLFFMTTNRESDVDDAIKSRCIAVIKYKTPERDARHRIWRTMSIQFNAEVSDETINTLVETYPTTSGRDIKELLKLTIKYAKAKNLPIEPDVIRKMAQFREL